MQKLIRKVQLISRTANLIGILFLIPLMLTTTVDVTMRGLFNLPVSGGLEMSQFMMVIIIWLTMAATTQKKGHVALQFIESKLSSKALHFSDCIVLVSMLVTMVLVNWALYMRMTSAFRNGETTDVLGWPIYPAVAIMFLGGLLVTLELLAELYNKLFSEQSAHQADSDCALKPEGK
jgi:TRAP-type C4-dicarboxylate transport system permease small subunit